MTDFVLGPGTGGAGGPRRRAPARPGHLRGDPAQARGDQHGAGDHAQGGLGLADRDRGQRLQQRPLPAGRRDRLDGAAGRLPLGRDAARDPARDRRTAPRTRGSRPGDMFVVNDPYKGPVHHPDMAVVAPIHVGDRLVAWAGAAAHEVDVGGTAVGSISVQAREKFQEGLMLPPVKLVDGGRPRRDVWRLILNMTRQPQLVELDLEGVRGLERRRAAAAAVELADRYGLDTVELVMRELIRYSERRFRRAPALACRNGQLPLARLRRPRRAREPALPRRRAGREGRLDAAVRPLGVVAAGARVDQLRREHARRRRLRRHGAAARLRHPLEPRDPECDRDRRAARARLQRGIARAHRRRARSRRAGWSSRRSCTRSRSCSRSRKRSGLAVAGGHERRLRRADRRRPEPARRAVRGRR